MPSFKVNLILLVSTSEREGKGDFGFCDTLWPIFQILMNKVTRGLDFCATYIDDVVIFSDDWKSHLMHNY